jgi:adenine-specific DNA methylase
MFIPRQLLGHLTLIEGLNRLKPEILDALGPERGRAVVTYLQFAIDKGLDYNSKQTRWIPARGIVSGTFGRHDFSVKWTFLPSHIFFRRLGARCLSREETRHETDAVRSS